MKNEKKTEKTVVANPKKQDTLKITSQKTGGVKIKSETSKGKFSLPNQIDK